MQSTVGQLQMQVFSSRQVGLKTHNACLSPHDDVQQSGKQSSSQSLSEAHTPSPQTGTVGALGERASDGRSTAVSLAIDEESAALVVGNPSEEHPSKVSNKYAKMGLIVITAA